MSSAAIFVWRFKGYMQTKLIQFEMKITLLREHP